MKIVFSKFLVQNLFPKNDRFLSLHRFEPLTDLGLGPWGLDKFEPILARLLIGRGKDFNRISAFELIFQGNDLSVHFCSDTMISDIGMDAVSEVDWSGPNGEFLHLAFRSKDIDLMGEEVDLDAFDKFFIIL